MLLWFTLNALLVLLAYLLGSLPPGYWAGWLWKGIDIREHGSGSTGATNVLRVIGKGAALAVLLVDILKGSVAVALVYWVYSVPAFTRLARASDFYQPDPDTPVPQMTDFFPWMQHWFEHYNFDPQAWLPWMVVMIGLAVVLGHSKSIFLNFTGGKSVATSLGILLAMNWIVALGTLATFAVVLAISRIVSLSSIAGAIAVMGLMFGTRQPLPYLVFGIAGGVFVILRHSANIGRLLAGTEPRIGEKLVSSETPQG
jgi:glycerol-3-phosphate acyltransferase PlsY